MKQEIPDKIYFKIGEVARLADVAPHVLRYWEAEFAEISPKRTQAGQRLYRRSDVELILTIKELLYTRGYTIAGARSELPAALYQRHNSIASQHLPHLMVISCGR
jgi:DNA-binding transcriptional MerR regulator